MADEQHRQTEQDQAPEQDITADHGEGDAATPAPADASADDSLEQALAEARARADEYWNTCVRLQAEMDNLRKRAERDLENAHKFALERFVGNLLPVRDSLEMGIKAALGEGRIDSEKLLEGTELTLKMLADALEKHGIEALDPEGQRFDPQFHEAMSMQPRDDVEPNTVVTVIQKGYLLNGRLLRPAMVIVSRAG